MRTVNRKKKKDFVTVAVCVSLFALHLMSKDPETSGTEVVSCGGQLNRSE